MKHSAIWIVGLAVLLSGCDLKKDAAPTGQVVATVDGTEITAAELRQEMTMIPPGMNPKQAQQTALQSIIARTILSAEARKQKLDQLPEAAIMKRRAEQLALIDMLSRRLRGSSPQPAGEEVEHYVAEHPSSFSERRIFVVDQLIVENSDPALLKAMEPLQQLDAIEALLKQRKVTYHRALGAIDALQIDPEAAEKIAGLPPQAVFASPDNGTIRVNRIRETVVLPVDNRAAKHMAADILQTQRSSDIVSNRINELLIAGTKSVRFNPAYEPARQAAPAGHANNASAPAK